MKQFCMMALAGLLMVGCQEVPKGYVINGDREYARRQDLLEVVP